MKKYLVSVISVTLCALMLFSFASCKDDSNKSSVKAVATTKRVGIDFDFQSCDDKGVIKVKTNLTEGLVVSVRVACKNPEYDKTIKATVVREGKDKYFITEPFTNDDKSIINDGSYVVIYQTDPASEQSDEVREIIGDKGQKLVGRNVYIDNGNYIARFTDTVTVKDGLFSLS